MPTSADEWRELTLAKTSHDIQVREAGSLATPETFWLPARELVAGGAMVGARFERHYIASVIRDRTILGEVPPEVKEVIDRWPPLSEVIMQFDARYLSMADAIESGRHTEW